MKSKTFIGILFIITFVGLCSSCFSQKKDSRKEINSANLTYNDINFYYKDNSFNFISDHLDDILAVFGKPLKIEELGGNENGPIARSMFSGISVEYYSNSGILREITIEKSDLSIINGFTIGDKRKDIEKYLINGIYYQADKSYLFFHMNEDQESGTGYQIFYDDKDNVQKIVISVIPLAI